MQSKSFVHLLAGVTRKAISVAARTPLTRMGVKSPRRGHTAKTKYWWGHPISTSGHRQCKIATTTRATEQPTEGRQGFKPIPLLCRYGRHVDQWAVEACLAQTRRPVECYSSVHPPPRRLCFSLRCDGRVQLRHGIRSGSSEKCPPVIPVLNTRYARQVQCA